MTGWRLGYAAGPQPIIKAMTDIQSQVTSNPTSIAQWAGIEALTGPQDEIAKMVGEFDRRRRFIVDALNAIPGVTSVMPKGAFYVFPNVSGTFRQALEGRRAQGSIASALFSGRCRIATVAGVDFGSDAHIRLSSPPARDHQGGVSQRHRDSRMKIEGTHDIPLARARVEGLPRPDARVPFRAAGSG
jgi:aspartate aminotransferase